MKVIEYSWQTVDDAGTNYVAVPDGIDLASYQRGYSDAHLEINCQVTDWMPRDDLKAFSVKQKLMVSGEPDVRIWVEFAADEADLRKRWNRVIRESRHRSFRVVKVDIAEICD